MLQQMNIAYSPAQDRLLFKINQNNEAEYRVWMTRRFTMFLLKVLRDQMDDSGGSQKLATSEDTVKQLKSGAFEKEYQNKIPQELPLGEDGILAYRINLKKMDNGVITLQLLPEDGKGVNFNLEKTMVYMLYNLLEQAINNTNWNLEAGPVAANLLH